MSIELTYLFDTTTVGTFDSDLIMFTNSSAQLKDLRPTSATFYADYSSSVNGNWGGGDLTGTAVLNATATGGYLDLTGSTASYVEYAATSNTDSLQTGCMRVIWAPNYTGAPSENAIIAATFKANNDSSNQLLLSQITNGNIRVVINDSSNVQIYQGDLGVWNAVLGQDYEFELNYNIDTAIAGNTAIRVFVDGTQFGVTGSGVTGTRDSNIGLVRLGQGAAGINTADFKIKSFLFYNSVQHTTDYTPGASISSTIFSTANPTIFLSTSFRHQGIDGWTETYSKAGSDEVKTTLTKNSSPYYHDGTGWTISANTYAQANTGLEISTNAATFATVTTVTTPRIFIHSDDGSTTPTLTSLQINYDYAGETPDSVTTCIVWGYSKSGNNTVDVNTITAELNRNAVQYKNNIITRNLSAVNATPETSTGYFELSLIETTNMTGGAKWIINFQNEKYAIDDVPATSTASFWSLIV